MPTGKRRSCHVIVSQQIARFWLGAVKIGWDRHCQSKAPTLKKTWRANAREHDRDGPGRWGGRLCRPDYARSV